MLPLSTYLEQIGFTAYHATKTAFDSVQSKGANFSIKGLRSAAYVEAVIKATSLFFTKAGGERG